ncbi:MAG TPA: peroxiredoxin-like family protein [Flavobacteriales bacterium]|nr:peroxiredoxin-like family protein [Flavobacteriales bacterium]
MNKRIYGPAIVSFVFFACSEPTPGTATEVGPEMIVTETYTPLADTLNAKRAAFEERATDEKKRIYAEGIASVENSGILGTAKQVGDTAVFFTLPNAWGAPVELKHLLANGPVVLTWYRGGWCPYCNLTLARLQEDLPKFKAAGGTLIALTPERPDSSLTTAEKNDLEFEILSDAGNGVARQYGVVFKLTDEVAKSYQESFGLHEFNGDASNELPLAATYVIGTDGVITYAFLHADYRERAEPRDILEALARTK